MRALIQRVSGARVLAGGQPVGAIGNGLCVFLGIGKGDDETMSAPLARKIVELRIFPDERHAMNRSLAEVGGAILLVSQFTLYADCRRGRRPSFEPAEAPARAEALYRRFASDLRALDQRVEEGKFGADMAVEITNVGPVSIWLDSADLTRARRS
jgi:D-tyrosyl-tRNA(Tyr) deacylase